MEPEQRPVECVGAGFGDHVHLARRTAELGGIHAGLHLEFLERVHRRQEDVGVEVDVGVVHAVEGVVVEFAALTRDRQLLVGAAAALAIARLARTGKSALTFGLRATS